MDIRSYTFEHLVLNNNEENTSTRSEESEPEADGNSGLRLNEDCLVRLIFKLMHNSMNILSLHLIQSFLLTITLEMILTTEMTLHR